MTRIPVGVVGLGAMGSAMASHLLVAGHDVHGVDVSGDRLTAFAGIGGTPSTPELLGQASTIVVTSLPSFAAARDVMGTDGPLLTGMAPGSVIIETSTLSVGEKISLRDSCAAAAVTLLDCPMSGTAHQARRGDVVAYVSGDPQAKEQVAPVLATFTRAVHDLGEFGNGTRAKLVANLLVAVHNVAAAEALTLAEATGLSLRSTLAAISDGAGTSRMLEVRGPLMVAEDYLPAGMRVDLFLKDLSLIADLASSVGVETALLEQAHAVYREAADNGRADEDTACAFSVLRRRREAAGQGS